jgi:hypothetical protein
MKSKFKREINENVSQVIEDVTRQILAWYEGQKTGKQIFELNFKKGIVTPDGYHLHVQSRPIVKQK